MAKIDLASIDKDIFMKLVASINSLNDDILATVLAWFYYNRKPLPVDIAYKIVKSTWCPAEVVLKRAPEELKLLFKKKYHAKFGQGMEPTVVVQSKEISYRLASPTLPHTLVEPISIPNVVEAKEQFDSLLEIWKECIDELRKFSRALGQG